MGAVRANLSRLARGLVDRRDLRKLVLMKEAQFRCRLRCTSPRQCVRKKYRISAHSKKLKNY